MDDSWLVGLHLGLVVSGDSISSLVGSSNRLSSGVEHEPLSIIPRSMVLDSQQVRVKVSLFMVEDSLVSGHLRSDLESDLVSEWLFLVSSGNLINPPGLVGSVVTFVEVNMNSAGIAWHVQALSSIVLNVSLGSIVPSDSVVVSSLELSH